MNLILEAYFTFCITRCHIMLLEGTCVFKIKFYFECRQLFEIIVKHCEPTQSVSMCARECIFELRVYIVDLCLSQRIEN